MDYTTSWITQHVNIDNVTKETILADDIYFPPKWLNILSLVISVCLGVFGVLFGTTVLAVLLMTKSTRSVGSAFVLNLVVSDLLLSVTLFTVLVWDLSGKLSGARQTVHSGTSCQLLGFLLSVFTYNSTLSVCVIALDRCLNVVNCLEFNHSTACRRAVLGLLFCWVQAIGWSVAPLLGWGRIAYVPARFVCVPDPSHTASYTGVVFITQFLLPVSLAAVCYVNLIRAAHKHIGRVSDENSAIQNKGGIDRHRSDVIVMDTFTPGHYSKQISLYPEFYRRQRQIILEILPGFRPHGQIITNNLSNIDQETVLDYHSNGSGSSNTCRNIQNEAKATVKLLGLVGLFILLWVQLQLINVLSIRIKVTQIWETLSFLLAYSCCVLDPLVYVIASRRFRYNLKRRMLFCIMKRKRPVHKKADDRYDAILKHLAFSNKSSELADSLSAEKTGGASSIGQVHVIQTNSPQDGLNSHQPDSSFPQCESTTLSKRSLDKVTKKKLKNKATDFLPKNGRSEPIFQMSSSSVNGSLSRIKTYPLPPIATNDTIK